MIVCILNGHCREPSRGLILVFVGRYFSLSWFVWQEVRNQGTQGLIPSTTMKKEAPGDGSELSLLLLIAIILTSLIQNFQGAFSWTEKLALDFNSWCIEDTMVLNRDDKRGRRGY